MIAYQIEAKRQEMIYFAKQYGYCAKETVKCSQELDKLLNQQWKFHNKTTIHSNSITNTYRLA